MTAARVRFTRANRHTLVGLSLLVALTGCGRDMTAELPRSTPSAVPSTTPNATGTPFPYGTEPVAVEPGTYRIPRSEWSVVDFTVTIPAGWEVQYGQCCLKNSDGDDELSFYAVVVDAIFTDACEGGEEFKEVGPRVDDFAAALLKQPGPTARGPIETTLGGYPAIRVDLTVPDGADLKLCNLEGIGLQIWYSPPADKYFVLLHDGIARVYIVDVDGQRQVFLAQYRSATSDEDLRELQAILDSIHIER